MSDSTNSAAAGGNRRFPPFLQLPGISGQFIFRGFPPFFRAIRQSSPLAVLALIAACATTPPPAERIVTRDVPVPYYQPCPKEADIPAPPKTVHEEHPTMPDAPTPKDRADVAGWIAALNASHARERILGAKVLEDRTYIERADGIMRACAKPASH